MTYRSRTGLRFLCLKWSAGPLAFGVPGVRLAGARGLRKSNHGRAEAADLGPHRNRPARKSPGLGHAHRRRAGARARRTVVPRQRSCDRATGGCRGARRCRRRAGARRSDRTAGRSRCRGRRGGGCGIAGAGDASHVRSPESSAGERFYHARVVRSGPGGAAHRGRLARSGQSPARHSEGCRDLHRAARQRRRHHHRTQPRGRPSRTGRAVGLHARTGRRS